MKHPDEAFWWYSLSAMAVGESQIRIRKLRIRRYENVRMPTTAGTLPTARTQNSAVIASYGRFIVWGSYVSSWIFRITAQFIDMNSEIEDLIEAPN